MQYTLRSRGRLLGHTDLGFIYRRNGFRCGWLHPTELGDRLMPVATGVGPALRTALTLGSDPTARADLLSAVDQEAALELELRGPSGAVIATEDIGITDTHYLLSIAHCEPEDENAVDAAQEASVEDLLEGWTEDDQPRNPELTFDEEPEFPRYQIQVRLADGEWLP